MELQFHAVQREKQPTVHEIFDLKSLCILRIRQDILNVDTKVRKEDGNIIMYPYTNHILNNLQFNYMALFSGLPDQIKHELLFTRYDNGRLGHTIKFSHNMLFFVRLFDESYFNEVYPAIEYLYRRSDFKNCEIGLIQALEKVDFMLEPFYTTWKLAEFTHLKSRQVGKNP